MARLLCDSGWKSFQKNSKISNKNQIKWSGWHTGIKWWLKIRKRSRNRPFYACDDESGFVLFTLIWATNDAVYGQCFNMLSWLMVFLFSGLNFQKSHTSTVPSKFNTVSHKKQQMVLPIHIRKNVSIIWELVNKSQSNVIWSCVRDALQ